jgi:hypothetical protein
MPGVRRWFFFRDFAVTVRTNIKTRIDHLSAEGAFADLLPHYNGVNERSPSSAPWDASPMPALELTTPWKRCSEFFTAGADGF